MIFQIDVHHSIRSQSCSSPAHALNESPSSSITKSSPASRLQPRLHNRLESRLICAARSKRPIPTLIWSSTPPLPNSDTASNPHLSPWFVLVHICNPHIYTHQAFGWLIICVVAGGQHLRMYVLVHCTSSENRTFVQSSNIHVFLSLSPMTNPCTLPPMASMRMCLCKQYPFYTLSFSRPSEQCAIQLPIAPLLFRADSMWMRLLQGPRSAEFRPSDQRLSLIHSLDGRTHGSDMPVLCRRRLISLIIEHCVSPECACQKVPSRCWNR